MLGLRLFSAIVVAAVLLFGVMPMAVSSAHGQGTFELTFQPFGDDDGVLAGLGSQWAPAMTEKPETCTGVPESLAKGAAFLYVQSAGGSVLMLAEPDPLRLFVDTDRDNDLSDEKALTDAKDGLFSGIAVKGLGDEAGEVRFNVRVYCGEMTILSEGGEKTQEKAVSFATLSPCGAYRAEATFGGEKYAIALVDGTLDGRVSDAYTPDKPCDMFAMDFDRDGRFDQWSETMPLPGTMALDGAFYCIAVTHGAVVTDASTVTFEKATPPVGTLECASPVVMLTALSDAGVFRLQPGVGKWVLPAGKYQVSSFELLTHDADGHEWRAGLVEAKGIETFDIREGETTTLKAGPPFTLTQAVTQNEREVSIVVNVYGQGGERYFPYPRTTAEGGGGATLTIFNEHGDEIASAQMEYG